MSEYISLVIARAMLAVDGLRTRQEGQTLVEYALILALVSILAIGALLALSGKINGVFNDIVNTL